MKHHAMRWVMRWPVPRALGMTLAVLAGGAGCIATSADFRLANVGANDAAIAGRLTIIYNGQIYTENCRATFGDSQLKLAPGGIVLFQVPKGPSALARLDCKDTSNQHIRIQGARFEARGDGWVSDFGDVVVVWNAVGGFKPSSMFGLIGALIDEASDDGTASVEVRPPAAAVREAFRHQTGVEGKWAVQPMSQPGTEAPAVAADKPAAGQTLP